MNSSRNIYRREIDFRALALQSPEFSRRLKANDQLDFSDPDAVRQLTKSLLERDFKIRVDLPGNRLCPPVPNRLNYILWLQDLLDTTSEAGDDEYDPEKEVLGLDIGTGCCSIYPLLGCSMRSRWKFFATDIDEDNIVSSRKTVSENQKSDRITVVKTDPDDLLIPLDKLGIDRLDFTMCNPPFYESEQELLSSAAAKSRPPYSACTGAAVEMITPGGEITFVSNMITQSLNLQTRVRWFTSMLGKLSSLSAIVQKLLDLDVENWAVTEFVQGKGTKRWAVAWSWMDWRPRSDLSRGLSTLPKHLLPFPSHFNVELPKDTKLEQVCSKLESELSVLRYLVHTWVTKESCVGFAREDVWSRKARRKFSKEQHTKSANENDDPDVMDLEEQWKKAPKDVAALGFRIDLRLEADTSVSMVIRWLKGMDQVLFESFCGMIKRKFGEE
ncbi:uncharacterized protein TRUGW13939_06975 [Talaromyces rugulosus]|uniref:U6 small nuclear RNA (adenine-(43)-N(6))-methyltransferase n=1 Tax=Talaromyces rugulosus TaxID=121627 RepID=A0A7H8R4M3_TALRU|nr:uncharacterized protein TRUGW13939_06975 [Talaromyces rugulosus]QKX59833.1 hypothetical protein TRUGW13939_06975 [Talaromyces rugulosus]